MRTTKTHIRIWEEACISPACMNVLRSPLKLPLSVVGFHFISGPLAYLLYNAAFPETI